MPQTTEQDNELMRSILQRIATGPELSKNISREEARTGMQLVLGGRVDPVQAGVFLIALRMKRETDEEMCGLLDAIGDVTRSATVPVDELVDLGDPYDGYTRSLPVAPFLPAVLAACGVPSVSHGVESMGPKHGVTHRRVLQAAGLPVDLSVDQAAARLADPAIGWAYIDQSVFCPKLFGLAPLRSLIVKRPALTTLEVLARPLRARRRTHLVTGYVHKAYPRIYALLARAAGFDSALLVRGVEGGVIPSLRHEGKCFYYHGNDEATPRSFAPAEFGFDSPLEPVAVPPMSSAASATVGAAVSIDLAATAADAGRRALDGEAGAARNSIVAAAALVLQHVGRSPTFSAGAAMVRDVLDDGRARMRLR